MKLRLAKKIMSSVTRERPREPPYPDGKLGVALRRYERSLEHKVAEHCWAYWIQCLRESRKLTCEDCGAAFEDKPYPANGAPFCDACLKRQFDEAEPVPLSEEEIERIITKALSLPGPNEFEDQCDRITR